MQFTPNILRRVRSFRPVRELDPPRDLSNDSDGVRLGLLVQPSFEEDFSSVERDVRERSSFGVAFASDVEDVEDFD